MSTHTPPSSAPGQEASEPARGGFREMVGALYKGEDDAPMPDLALRILEEAMVLFARKGYAATSVREIVTQAKATNPMLYYYFESKEGVFRRLIELIFELFGRTILALFEEPMGLRERVELILATHLLGVSEAPQVVRFVYSVLLGPTEGAPPTNILVLRQPVKERITVMFERAIERGEFTPREGMRGSDLAELLLGLVNQEIIKVLKEQETASMSDPANEAAQRLVEFFFHGATGSSTSRRADRAPSATERVRDRIKTGSTEAS